MDKVWFVLLFAMKSTLQETTEELSNIDNANQTIQNHEDLIQRNDTSDSKESVSGNDNNFKYEITENNSENSFINFTNIITSTSNQTSTNKTPTEAEHKPFTNPKYLSILHIKIDNEDRPHNTAIPEGIDPLQIIKPNLNVLNFLAENAVQYIDGLKKGVASSVNSLGNINYQPYFNRVVFSNLAAAPVSIFNKIHRKTIDTAARIQDFVWGQNNRQ